MPSELTSWEEKALDRIEAASVYLRQAKHRIEGPGPNLDVAKELLAKARREIREAEAQIDAAQAEGF